MERQKKLSQKETGYQFQSTFPAKGTTAGLTFATIFPLYFNPRSQRRERLDYLMTGNEEVQFQSTFPAKGTTD